MCYKILHDLVDKASPDLLVTHPITNRGDSQKSAKRTGATEREQNFFINRGVNI
jgi:hypothetical protein